MAKEDKPDPSKEEITITRGELDALKATAERDAKMDPAEKRLRAISREEGKAGALEALEEFFSDLGGEGGDEGKGGENNGGEVSVVDALKSLVGWSS